MNIFTLIEGNKVPKVERQRWDLKHRTTPQLPRNKGKMHATEFRMWRDTETDGIHETPQGAVLGTASREAQQTCLPHSIDGAHSLCMRID